MLALRPSSQIIPWNIPTSYNYPVYRPPEPEKKSSLWDWYRSLQEPEQSSPLESAVTGLRHNAEGAGVGAILGFIDAEFGLDIQGKYPIDGALAFLLYLWSIRDSGKPGGFASDLRALSQSCSTVFTYRKTKDWREGQKVKVIPRNSDPILAAGETIGVKIVK
jgi:hypothetical protein